MSTMTAQGPLPNSKPLAGKTALITGAGRGIGAATARRLALEGAQVILVSRTEREIQALASELNSAYGSTTAQPIKTDLSVCAEIEKLFSAIQNSPVGLDILINNAAGFWSG